MRQLFGSRRIGHVLVAGLGLALGACNGANDPGIGSLEQSVPNPSTNMQALAEPKSTTLAPAAAIASLPEEAGAVKTVRGRGYVNGFRQDILLEGSAVRGVENGITVLVRTSQQATLDEATPLFKPTEAAIRSELSRTFPHLSMKVVERSSSNSYGAYGLALGRAGGNIHCIYAWQWIDESGLSRDTGLSGPATVRIRLCRPNATFDALAALVDHLTINRYTATEHVAESIVEPPTAPSETPSKSKPRKHAASHHKRHATEQASVDQAGFVAPSTIAAAPVAVQPLASDLPPQAYQGPRTKSSFGRPN